VGRLDGKVAFITGAARGQGRSHAVTFAEEGADLALVDVCAPIAGVKAPLATPDDLRETVRRCEALGRRVVSAACDVRDQGQVDAAVALALGELGQIDVLINNAGVSSPIGRAWELDEDQWRVVLDIDLDGAWRCAKAVAPHMIERRSGCILNTASAAGLKGLGSNAAYITAKHGLIGLTRSLAVDLAPHRIRVNAVCPGSVRDDPALDGAMLRGCAVEWGLPLDTYQETFAGYHLLDELIEARDVSLAYVWLASDEGARVTGIALPVDAGFVAR
jgi:SDR family mycofactocin-dependent oxidoreductase